MESTGNRNRPQETGLYIDRGNELNKVTRKDTPGEDNQGEKLQTDYKKAHGTENRKYNKSP